MTNTLLLTFIISLIYMAIANRLFTYVTILAFQGIVLFGAALIELTELSLTNLVFILFETIVFKAIAIPGFLNYIIKRNNITREAEPFLSNFISVIIVTGIIVSSFLLSSTIQDGQLKGIFFVVALSSLFTGLYLIVTRKKIITHVMGFLVIENGVFVLSLAVGNEMPMVINTGIMLDIFVSVLVLGIFINRIGDVLKEHDAEQLQQLRD